MWRIIVATFISFSMMSTARLMMEEPLGVQKIHKNPIHSKVFDQNKLWGQEMPRTATFATVENKAPFEGTISAEKRIYTWPEKGTVHYEEKPVEIITTKTYPGEVEGNVNTYYIQHPTKEVFNESFYNKPEIVVPSNVFGAVVNPLSGGIKRGGFRTEEGVFLSGEELSSEEEFRSPVIKTAFKKTFGVPTIPSYHHFIEKYGRGSVSVSEEEGEISTLPLSSTIVLLLSKLEMSKRTLALVLMKFKMSPTTLLLCLSKLESKIHKLSHILKKVVVFSEPLEMSPITFVKVMRKICHIPSITIMRGQVVMGLIKHLINVVRLERLNLLNDTSSEESEESEETLESVSRSGSEESGEGLLETWDEKLAHHDWTNFNLPQRYFSGSGILTQPFIRPEERKQGSEKLFKTPNVQIDLVQPTIISKNKINEPFYRAENKINTFYTVSEDPTIEEDPVMMKDMMMGDKMKKIKMEKMMAW